MHSAYFVKVSKENATTSGEAREQAIDILERENFGGERGFFSGGRADWYVIGGRWSGTLTQVVKEKEYKEFIEEANKEIAKYPEENRHSPETLAINKHLSTPELTDYLNALYQAKLGTTCPFTRDTYVQEGYDDDAAIITPELRAALIRADYGDTDVFDSDHYVEETVEDLSEDDDGNWLVIIDYHS